MQYLLPVAVTDRYSLSTKLTGNISDKLSSIFSVCSIPPITARVTVIYFMVKSCSCIHTVQPLNSPKYSEFVFCIIGQYIPNSAKFRKNIEIPRKRANSAARLKIPRSMENGKLWSL